MNPLPYVTAGYKVPPIQRVLPGIAANYIGIYVIDQDEPRIVVELTHELFKFGKVERWSPVFQCEVPLAIDPNENKNERLFQISFTGVPGRTEDFHRTAICDRQVLVTSIKNIFEGENPPIVR